MESSSFITTSTSSRSARVVEPTGDGSTSGFWLNVGPYAGPGITRGSSVASSGEGVDPGTARLGPFVPATIENEPQAAPVQSASESLPWIETFLATTPATPMTAIAEDVTHDAVVAVADLPEIAAEGEAETEADEPVDATSTDQLAVEASEEETLEIVDVVEADEWPLEEAAIEVDDIARRITSALPDVESANREVEPHEPQVLPEWSDDDAVEIMPVRQPLFTPRHSLPVDDVGSQMSDRQESAEAAAHALELLAQRVRAGELALAGYEPRMGDAAALAAALTALLGADRG